MMRYPPQNYPERNNHEYDQCTYPFHLVLLLMATLSRLMPRSAETMVPPVRIAMSSGIGLTAIAETGGFDPCDLEAAFRSGYFI
jgi:hypothetical protein